MLSALPSNLTPSAVAAADSLSSAPRSSAKRGSGFAALMQRQSDLRLSDLRSYDLHLVDQRLEVQRQTQAQAAASGFVEAAATGTLRREPAHQPQSGSTPAVGANPRPADGALAGRSTAPDNSKKPADAGAANHRADRSRGEAHSSLSGSTADEGSAVPRNDSTRPAPTQDNPKPAGAAPGDSTENRNAASLTLNSKLQRARTAAQDAARQAAAGTTLARAASRPATASVAVRDSSSTDRGGPRSDDSLLASTATPDTALLLGALPVGAGVALPSVSVLPGGVPGAATPVPSAVVPDVADVAEAGQPGDSLSATGRASPQRMPLASGTTELASPPVSSRSTAGWVAEQQRLRGAGSSGPTAGSTTLLPSKPAVDRTDKLAASLPGPATSMDAGSDSALTAAGLVATALTPVQTGSNRVDIDFSTTATATAGAEVGLPGRPSDLPGTAPGLGNAAAATSTGAMAASGGASRRDTALSGALDNDPPEGPASMRRSGPASGLAERQPSPPGEADAGRSARWAGTASPGAQANSLPPAPTAIAALAPNPGTANRSVSMLVPDQAGADPSRDDTPVDAAGSSGGLPASGSGIKAGIETGSETRHNAPVTTDTGTVLAGTATVGTAEALRSGSAAARRAGDAEALNTGTGAGPRSPADPGSAASLRPDASAAVGQPAHPVALAGSLAAPGDTASATHTNRLPADSNNPAPAPNNPIPVAGEDLRRAQVAAPGLEGAAASRRPASADRPATPGRDSAITEAADPSDLPASRRDAQATQAARPLISTELAALLPAHAPATAAGLDHSQARHSSDTVTLAAASDAIPAAMAAASTAAASAAAPAAPLNRNDASSPTAVPVEARISAPLDSPTFAPALGAQISLFARDGVQTARLQLNPAEMGPIAVQIAVDGNAARIEFQADRAATREVLEASLPALAGALQDAGLTLTGGGVFQQHPGRQAPPEPGPASVPARLSAQGTGLDAVAGGLAAANRQRTPRGLVDLVA